MVSEMTGGNFEIRVEGAEKHKAPLGILDMVKGGNVTAIVADEAYELGRAMAAAGARALVGEETPPFVVAPAVTVTPANVEAGWKQSLHRDAPESVINAAK